MNPEYHTTSLLPARTTGIDLARDLRPLLDKVFDEARDATRYCLKEGSMAERGQGLVIAGLRKYHKMEIFDVASAVGVSAYDIRMLEEGTKRNRPGVVRAVGSLLGIEPEWLAIAASPCLTDSPTQLQILLDDREVVKDRIIAGLDERRINEPDELAPATPPEQVAEPSSILPALSTAAA